MKNLKSIMSNLLVRPPLLLSISLAFCFSLPMSCGSCKNLCFIKISITIFSFFFHFFFRFSILKLTLLLETAVFLNLLLELGVEQKDNTFIQQILREMWDQKIEPHPFLYGALNRLKFREFLFVGRRVVSELTVGS